MCGAYKIVPCGYVVRLLRMNAWCCVCCAWTAHGYVVMRGDACVAHGLRMDAM